MEHARMNWSVTE